VIGGGEEGGGRGWREGRRSTRLIIRGTEGRRTQTPDDVDVVDDLGLGEAEEKSAVEVGHLA
jgi:hypothetical protein